MPSVPPAPAAPPVSRTPSSSGRPMVGVPSPAPATPSAPATGTAAAAAVRAPTGPVPQGMRRVTFTYDVGPNQSLKNLALKGSFDAATGAFDPGWGGPQQSIPMRSLGGGKWAATVDLKDDAPHDWRWGVTADGPTGRGQWAIMGEEPLKLDLRATSARTISAAYSPTTYQTMGAHREGNDLAFGFWAPNAKGVAVKITSEDGSETRVPLARDADGTWRAKVAGGFSSNVGSAYVYEVKTSDGKTVDRADPYARQMQGEQRGLGRMYIDPATGKETNVFHAGRLELMRFEIGNEPGYAGASLVLKDASGRQLSKREILDRVGAFDGKLVEKAREGKFNDFFANHVKDDGTIEMVNAGGDHWTALVNNPEKLAGLRYELQVWEKGPNGELRLHDDKNRDNVFTEAERRASPNNDKWSDVITPASGRTFRGSVITDNSYVFKSDAAPREKDPRKWINYQVHVGSFFGMEMNARRSTFKDIEDRLEYLKKLGVNTLELLPTNEVEGERDWGYMGASSLAVESAYGFEEDHRWVTGTEALKRFVDLAHEKGFNVVNDVVYNHVGGEHNFMWELDGPENPYFNWSADPKKLEKRDTPWGAVPAYNKPQVKQFFVDHATAQLDEFHFDGLRFDFTEPIKGTGGKDGWEMLREINRNVHFLNPNAWVVAEQFDYDPAITTPSGSGGAGGAGFDAQWYTEFQHRLVNDSAPFKPGLLQAAANGWRTDVDSFMGMLTGPRGLTGWKNALTIISNHDEVGNAQRTIDVADGASTAKVPPPYARGLARFAAGIGLASPGIPMFFMGDESMAQNPFKWGNPATWDLGWDWESDVRTPAEVAALPAGPEREKAELNLARRQSFEFYRDALALRKSSPAFEADAAVERVYTHNDNSVMAFTRKKDGEEMLVVGSLNRNNFSNYRMNLPPGKWKEVLNSDGAKYGGGNFGNGGGTIDGGSTGLNIPAGGYVVFKKVG